MFVLGVDHGVDDLDQAFADCRHGPPGCEVLDTKTGEWLGPTCWEEIEAAEQRLAEKQG
jgi:hypothetical protein